MIFARPARSAAASGYQVYPYRMASESHAPANGA